MLNKYVKKPVKRWVKQKLRNSYNEFESEKVKPKKLEFTVFFPISEESDSYIISNHADDHKFCELGLPVPPQNLWLGYGTSIKDYLFGKQQILKMEEIVSKAGHKMEDFRRILDFGCGAGRMIRWLKPYTDRSEIWGTDISSEHIYWANKYLNPPFNFVTTTTIPHLPFEDRYFDFIYAGSVFSHIDDLAKAWLLELRRVLSKEGYLYVTINDRHSIDLLKNNPIYKKTWLSEFIKEHPVFSQENNEFGMIVGKRGPESQVFYDMEFFSDSVKPFFEVISIVKEAYGFQSGVLMKKVK